MKEKPVCDELNREIKRLKKEVREQVRQRIKYNEQLKMIEYRKFKRTVNMMRINEELEKEIERLRSANEARVKK